jgi:hypothetical protein
MLEMTRKCWEGKEEASMSERGRSHDVLSFEKFSISNSPTPNRERNAVIDFDSDLDVGGGGGGEVGK